MISNSMQASDRLFIVTEWIMVMADFCVAHGTFANTGASIIYGVFRMIWCNIAIAD